MLGGSGVVLFDGEFFAAGVLSIRIEGGLPALPNPKSGRPLPQPKPPTGQRTSAPLMGGAVLLSHVKSLFLL